MAEPYNERYRALLDENERLLGLLAAARPWIAGLCWLPLDKDAKTRLDLLFQRMSKALEGKGE